MDGNKMRARWNHVILLDRHSKFFLIATTYFLLLLYSRQKKVQHWLNRHYPESNAAHSLCSKICENWHNRLCNSSVYLLIIESYAGYNEACKVLRCPCPCIK